MGFNIDILKKTLGLNFGNIKNIYIYIIFFFCIVNSSHLCSQIDMQVNNVKSHNDLAHPSIVGCFSYSAREFFNQR
jgi:hypothetical protein